MARGQQKAIGSFLSPSAAPVPMPVEPVQTGVELVAAFFALHPDRWFTCEDVAAATRFSRYRCANFISALFRKGEITRHLPANASRRNKGQTYRWAA